MIREAIDFDIPAIVGMVKDLHASTRMAVPVEDNVVRRTLQLLVSSPQGLLLVAGDAPQAFIAASIGLTSVSSVPIAIEHGWWASPAARGAGIKLLNHYERWARQQGCGLVRMSTPPWDGPAARILERRGYSVSEWAWGKSI